LISAADLIILSICWLLSLSFKKIGSYPLLGFIEDSRTDKREFGNLWFDNI